MVSAEGLEAHLSLYAPEPLRAAWIAAVEERGL